MSNDEYITKITSNEITPEELETDINNDKYKIKNLNYEEIKDINGIFSFATKYHSLYIAIYSKNPDIVKLTLKHGGKPLNQKDVGNKHYFGSRSIDFTHTLHHAIRCIFPYMLETSTPEEINNHIKKSKDSICKIIKLLVENGAEVVNESQYSTLHYAVETRCIELIQLVIAHGAKYVEGKRRSTYSAMAKSSEELAQETGNKDIIELVSQQKEKIGPKCSKLVQSTIKNGTTYPLDEGRYTKRENKILDKCPVEPILDKMNDNLKITL